MMTPVSRRLGWPTYVGLALALGWSFAFLVLTHAGTVHLADRGQDIIVIVREWSVSVVLAAIVIFWERLPLTSVGFKMPHVTDAGFVLLTIVMIFVGNGVAMAIGSWFTGGHLAAQPASLAGILSIPLWIRVAISITAGICEEFTVRGYAIERLTRLTSSRFLGAAIPCVLFTLGHVRLYGFGVDLLPVLATSIALTLLYVWRRNVVLNMTAHALIDLYGLLLQPLINHP
jgi:membrane protease YdiL (CAAX protease family)